MEIYIQAEQPAIAALQRFLRWQGLLDRPVEEAERALAQLGGFFLALPPLEASLGHAAGQEAFTFSQTLPDQGVAVTLSQDDSGSLSLTVAPIRPEITGKRLSVGLFGQSEPLTLELDLGRGTPVTHILGSSEALVHEHGRQCFLAVTKISPRHE